MDFKIIWSERSQCDLREIASFIGRSDPAAAIRTGDALIDCAEPLQQFPEMGSIYRRAPGGPYRELRYGRYRIIYVFDRVGKRVEIVTVRHVSRDDPLLP